MTIAALPMYDWPEARADTDAEWADLRARLIAAGIDAPEDIVRRNAEMPAVPGGIRDGEGRVIAPDPATLPPDEFDFQTLWKHPALLFAQTCWGPMEEGLAEHVSVVGQPSYDGIEGGQGELYSSAILMRREFDNVDRMPPPDGRAILPLDLIRNKRFAYNSLDSMSGIIALTRDLEAPAKASPSSPSASRRRPIAPRSSPLPRAGRMSAPSTAAAGTWRSSTSRAPQMSWSSAGRRGARACRYITSRHTPPEIVARLHKLALR